jgi:hypothetical protein
MLILIFNTCRYCFLFYYSWIIRVQSLQCIWFCLVYICNCNHEFWLLVYHFLVFFFICHFKLVWLDLRNWL